MTALNVLLPVMDCVVVLSTKLDDIKVVDAILLVLSGYIGDALNDV